MRNSRKKRRRKDRAQTNCNRKEDVIDHEATPCTDALKQDDEFQYHETVHSDLEKDKLVEELTNERAAHEATKVRYLQGRSMAKTYWERWRYELEERKQLQKYNLGLRLSYKQFRPIVLDKTTAHVSIPMIDRSLLCDPIEFGELQSDSDLFVGRGSFGIVKCQLYHGIHVAVKEFLPHTLKDSVEREAQLLFELCHPYLPLLFGICTLKLPYILVVQ